MKPTLLALLCVALLPILAYGQQIHNSKGIWDKMARDAQSRDQTKEEREREIEEEKADEALAIKLVSASTRQWSINPEPITGKMVAVSPRFVWLANKEGTRKVNRFLMPYTDQMIVYKQAMAALKKQKDIKWPAEAMKKPVDHRPNATANN